MSAASFALRRSAFRPAKAGAKATTPTSRRKPPKSLDFILNPPEHALVLAVDEKPSIQALERRQGYLKLANGRALTGQSHQYKRHGTTTLFAAFDVASGKVSGRHYKRRRRIEFLDFMKDVAEHRAARSMSSSTISTPINRRMTVGSSATPTFISTSRPRRRLGSIRWKSGSRSSPQKRCPAPPSAPSPNSRPASRNGA